MKISGNVRRVITPGRHDGPRREPVCGLDQRYTASSSCTLDTSATLAIEGITGQISSARGEPLGLLADELPSWRMLTS